MNLLRPLLLLFVLAFLLRIFIMLYSLNFRENTDILRWKDWGRVSFLYSPAETYKTDHLTFGTLPNNMPPGTLYIVNTMYNSNITFNKILIKITKMKEGSNAWINSTLPNIFFRIPSMLSDLGIGYLIYKIIRCKKEEKFALFGSSLFLFNPVILYNSSFWGQMDSLNNLFFYLSFYFLYKKNYIFPLILLFLSLYIKLSLIFFLPIIIIIMLVLRKKSQLIISAFLGLMLLIILTIPISTNSPAWIINYLSKNSLGEMENITNFAFNFWWLIFKPQILIESTKNLFAFSNVSIINSPLSSEVFLRLPLTIWSYILFTVFSIPVLIKIVKLKTKVILPENLSLIFSVIALLGFLFLPRMHERYMYPVFPMLATYVALKGRYFLPFLLLTLLNFINLYFVWHPFLIFSELLTMGDIIGNINIQWIISIATLIASVIFYFKSIRFSDSR